jgi:hypothetical protein
MSTFERYAVRMPTRLDHDAVAEAMLTVEMQPLWDLHPFDLDRHGTPALIDDVTMFASRIPNVPFGHATHWMLKDGVFTFRAMIMNAFRKASTRDDPDPEREGTPTRTHVLLDALSAISDARDGEIVGGWMGDHHVCIKPVVRIGGRVVLLHTSGNPDYKPIPDYVEHDGIIDADAILLDDEGMTGAIMESDDKEDEA